MQRYRAGGKCKLVAYDYFWLRRRTISLSDFAFLLRVLRPRAGLPHGVDGALRPTGAFTFYHHRVGDR